MLELSFRNDFVHHELQNTEMYWNKQLSLNNKSRQVTSFKVFNINIWVILLGIWRITIEKIQPNETIIH